VIRPAVFKSFVFLACLAGPLSWRAAADTLYTIDINASAVMKISPAGVASQFAHFDGVDGGLALDRSGNVYVNGLSGVFKITPDGIASHLAISNTAAAGNLAFDSTGILYAGINESQIVAISPAGVVTRFVAIQENGLAVDSSNNLYVSNYFPGAHGEIDKFTPQGNFSLFASALASPQGLAFDSHGNLFVAEGIAGTIDQISPSGVLTNFASGLSMPTSLAFGSNDNLFVTTADSSFSQSIDEISPTGVVTPYASGLNSTFAIAVAVPEPSAMFVIIGVGLSVVGRRRWTWKSKFGHPHGAPDVHPGLPFSTRFDGALIQALSIAESRL
jgi:sugar lactone lactonase YvrE